MPLSRFLCLLVAVLTSACSSTPTRTAQLPALPNLAAPSPGVFTAGRLQPADIATLERAGIAHIVDLSLDDETPTFDEAAAVREAGMQYDNLAINGAADLTIEMVRTFDRLMSDAESPVLVHCASSNRVGALAALRSAWLQGRTDEEALEEGRRWGLKGLEPAVRERLARPRP